VTESDGAKRRRLSEIRTAREMVLHMDDDLLIINKPAGLNVMPGPGRFGDRSIDALRPAMMFGASEMPR